MSLQSELVKLCERLEAYSNDDAYTGSEVAELIRALLARYPEAAQRREDFKSACRWAWDQEDVATREWKAGAEAYRRYPDKEVSP
ncbi:MAG: hypothetical protein WC683_04265 [bacterium]